MRCECGRESGLFEQHPGGKPLGGHLGLEILLQSDAPCGPECPIRKVRRFDSPLEHLWGKVGALGLRGHVHPKRFEEVLAGYVPHTDIRLGRMRDGEHQHRPGLDITLSAPKSVSLEGLVFGARRVVRAHDEAVRETLDWIEADLLQTRGYDPATGKRPRERAHGMVAAEGD